MPGPDQRHRQPSAADLGFGRFGNVVGENFQLWMDHGLGMEIGGIVRPGAPSLDGSTPDRANYIPMSIAMPFEGKTAKTVDHTTLFVLPRPDSYELVSARAFEPEWFEPGTAVQMLEWVADPKERPLTSFRRNIGLLPIEADTIYVPQDPFEIGHILQSTVDQAIDRREREAIRAMPADDQAMRDVLGEDVFDAFGGYQFNASERRAG